MSNLNEPERKPALTVVVQSWATPLIGLLMLVVGMVAGFYLRPLFGQPDEPEQQASAVTPPTSAVVAPVDTGQTVPTAASTADPTAVAESQASLMEFLVGQTKHFEGDPNAPVTIIEFSDFQ
jgi:protein-disulfide isomerase